MSYDVRVEVDGAVVFDENYTSNCSGMWARALDLPERVALDDDGRPRICRQWVDGEWVEAPLMDWGLRLLAGAPCSEAARFLARAVDRMRADPDVYRAMNPQNGWGNYETATGFLARVAKAAAENPDGIIGVSS